MSSARPSVCRALQQPLDDLLAVDGEHDHGVEPVAGERDHPVELLDLGQRARVAVEQEARRAASGSSMRLRTIWLVTSSGTYSPASMYALGLDARAAVPWETLARKMSPVEIAGMPKCSATNLAWVPLPAPGGP